MPYHACEKCKEHLDEGTRVLQMLGGQWRGAETPAFAQLFAEWHARCFGNEFELRGQQGVYHCEKCGEEIKSGETVFFVVEGCEAGDDFTLAEKRGRTIYGINHFPACPK